MICVGALKFNIGVLCIAVCSVNDVLWILSEGTVGLFISIDATDLCLLRYPKKLCCLCLLQGELLSD